MKDIQEKKMGYVGGGLMLLVFIGLLIFAVWAFVNSAVVQYEEAPDAWFALSILALVVWGLGLNGFFIVSPNDGRVFTFFGNYVGSARESGFWFTNPLTKRAKVSLKIRNFNSQTLKVNDAGGNPIEIAAVVVWRVVDTAKALYAVESYENFVNTQSETAIRSLASHFPYDVSESEKGQTTTTKSLRGSPEEVAKELQAYLEARLEAAGVTVVEARLSHLAYAPEIAQAMLRRQQAEAVISARRLIVDGAVGMVQLALRSLEENGVVKLDNERRAAMVNNLLVALVSDQEAQPVINTGTLYA